MKKAPIAAILAAIVCVLMLAAGCTAASTASSQGEGGLEDALASEIEILLGEFFFQMEDRAKGAPVVLEVERKYELSL